MTSVRGRGRGGMGGPRGGGPAGGAERGQEGQNTRRGSWRGGPPGSNGSFSAPRGGSPSLGSSNPAPRTSINDHMNLMGKVTDDRARSASAKGFQTDADISATGNQGAHRDLQPWSPDGPEAAAGTNGAARNGGHRDAETFGLDGPSANMAWDQFETNARLFGATTDYKEEIYTTKLDRSGAGYKQREKEANRLANEIMNQTATNSHIAEERNQAVEGAPKDEEEKYSGVLRAPNAYVPPGARRNAGPGNTPARVQATGAPAAAKANGVAPAPSSQPAPPSKSASSTSDATVPPGAKAPAPLAVPAPARSSSDVQPASEKVVDTKPGTLSPQPESAQSANKEEKAQPPTSVVDQFRSFVGSEREKVEAKKQSMVKQERERTLADLKKFQTNFKVPLPMPKDILPLLAKDAEKQKAIEEKAALALEDAKRKPEAAAAKASPSTSQPKKIAMKIPEIPPFKPKVSPNPPTIPVPESASKDIPQATSPTPSAASHASGNLQAKLNPNASSFVFKPNPAAAAFKPGQSSTVTSPASRSAQLQPALAVAPSAGPSAPKNAFFREQPQPTKGIDTRSDFNPWKQGPLPAASSINPAWPYTGRKYNASFMPGPPSHLHPMGGFDEDPSSPIGGPPHVMPVIPPNYPPYGYRFQPGMPPQGMPGHMGNAMFSPGSQFQQLPSGPIPGQGHLGAPPNAPMGMPMHHFYQNGVPQNPQFIPPHLPFNPNARGGPGGPPPNAPMFFGHQHSQSTPHQTPQVPHAPLQQPPPSFNTSPLPPPQAQLAGGGFEKFDGNAPGSH
ncbi:putative mRNA polyadenylation-related protein [Papiliotrema laurentii]|uniref:mRNA polyadenylation-related protein n=1 Tax=Papiliotrema laurentii TaxID=5418 RepID=A0AAD9FVQ3_PAPLA|nr:putative mRNA polyadenylation-related protein [Papiliotrema laurentii]